MTSVPLRQQHQGTESTPLISDVMKLALSMCESGRLQYVSATCCRFRIALSAPGEKKWWYFDLKDYFLPATLLVRQCELSEEPELAIATVLAIDTYLRSAQYSKASHKTVSAMVKTIAKCWEWGRLNGIYRAEDWSAGHFRLLEKQLVQGRWALALQGESRIQHFLSTRPAVDSIALTDSRFAIRSELSRMLGTNMNILELGCGRNSIHRYVEPNPPAQGWDSNTTPGHPSSKGLMHVFWAVNLLGNVVKPYGFKLTPFPDPWSRARRLGTPNARTPTLSVDQAIGLLVYSMKCVDQYSELICDLVYEVGRIAFEAGQAKANRMAHVRLIKRLWEESLVRASSSKTLGFDVSISSTSIRGSKTVSMLVDMLMIACVVLIASLNARRKDEIIHKTLGLRRDSIRPINEELGVYEGMFYIEKTLKSYAPYFTNQETFDAYSVLQKLEQAQLDVETLFTGEERSAESISHSMFWSRSVATTSNRLMPRAWFTFDFNRKGAGRAFTAAALGEDVRPIGGGAHIFRRLYAILYYYRFEHGGLLSVRYQLAHLNCEMTKQYVTSAMIDTVEARIPIAMRRPPENVRAAIEADWQALDKVIQEVGNEKLLSVIVDLLDGQTFSGGFPRLVERLHRRFLKDLDYSAMDRERQARRLQQRLISRGHGLRPFPQADCAAGTSRARGAKCSNNEGGGPAPENASADICCTCPYSWTSQGHIEGLKSDLKVLDDDLTMATLGTLLHDSLATARANLQRAIWLHEDRVKKAHE